MRILQKTIKTFLLLLIKTYRILISPYIGRQCRFYPSCSCYTQEAIEHYGVLKGGYLGISRVIKCHPFHPGGYDPLPQKPSSLTE